MTEREYCGKAQTEFDELKTQRRAREPAHQMLAKELRVNQYLKLTASR